MFESVVRTVLNKFLGEYVSNLETNQLNVGIFSGNVVLHGLKLKREALDRLNLPIAVYQGYLGKLELQIPWTNLKQQPVVVTVSDLYVLAGPKILADVDLVEEAEKEYRSKMERIETAELFDLESALNADAAERVVEETRNESFTTQLINKIVDNLQVRINNIHFRFEDHLSHPEQNLFSFGFTLESLSAVSSDANWVETLISEATDQIFKLVDLQDLAIYWDSWTKQSLQNLPLEEFLEKFLHLVHLEEDRNHILQPITGQAKITINKRKFKDEPMTLVNLFFDQFALLFDDAQYFDLLSLCSFFVMSARVREYSALRPVGVRLKQDPLTWFRYAVNANLRHIQERNRKQSWDYVLERRKARLAYTDLFFQKLQLGEAPLPPELQESLIKYERTIPYRDLRIYRNYSRRQFQKWQETSEAKRSSGGWLNWLMSPAGASVQPTSIAELVKDSDIQELYDTIDFHDDGGKSQEHSPTEKLFQIILDVGTVSLNIGKTDASHENVTSVASLVLRMFSGSFIKRAASVRTEVALQELILAENLLENSQFREIIRSRSLKYELEYDEDAPFFHLTYDELTENHDADALLCLSMQPLEVIVNHQAALLLKDFMIGGRNQTMLDNLMGLAVDQLSQFQVWTKYSLERALSEHKSIDFFIDIDAPILVVPENCAKNDSFAFVADLGHVKVRSKLVTQAQKAEVISSDGGEQLDRVKLHSIKEYLYDNLLASLSSLKLFYFNNLLDCQNLLQGKLPLESSALGEYEITKKVDLDLQIGNCILPPNAELPDTKIKGTIPIIEVFFSDEKYRNFMKLLDIFLPPKEDEPSGNAVGLSNIFNASTTSLVDLIPHPRSSPPLVLPQLKSSSSFETESGSDEEFQDAVENPEDLKIQQKHPYDHTSLEMVFAIEQVKGHVVRRIGKAQKIGLIEVDSLKVVIENRPWDIVVKTFLKAFRLTEQLKEDDEHVLVDGHQGENTEGLLQVIVTLVNPIHPLYKTVHSSAGITVDVEISSIGFTMDPPTIMHLIRYVTDTFPKGDDQATQGVSRAVSRLDRKQSRLERGLSKLTQSASTKLSFSASTAFSKGKLDPVKEDDREEVVEKILINVRLMELLVTLGPSGSCIGKLNLKQAALGITYEGPGKLLLVGKLGSLVLTPQDLGIGPYAAFTDMPFAIVEGGSVIDFTYQMFPKEEALKAGHDVALTLKSGSMHLVYMPQFLRYLFELLADLRRATLILDSTNDRVEASIDAPPCPSIELPSRFHYEIEVLSPVIVMASPKDSEERLSFYPGNLSISNTFRVDPKSSTGAWDTLIDVSLRDLHIDVLHRPHVASSVLYHSLFAAPMDLAVRVTQAHSPLERSYAQIEVEVSLGKAKFMLGDSEYTLAMNLLNWFTATQPTVMERINLFLSAGSPVASPIPPTSSEEDFVTMEVQVLIDHIEASITNYHRVAGKDSVEGHPLSDLVFHDLHIDYLAHASGSMSVEGYSMVMNLHDTRPDPGRCFTSVFGHAKEKKVDPESPMVLARYERLLPSRQIVTRATLDSPQLVLVLDHLFAIKRFFADGLPKSPIFVDPVLPSGYVLSTDPWSSSTMLSMARGTVYILEDAHHPDTEAIELSLPEFMYTSSVDEKQVPNTTLTLDKISMALLNMDSRDTTRLNFIDHFDVLMTTEEKGVGADSCTRSTIQLSPIVMRFAQQDVALFQALMAKFTKLNATVHEQPKLEDNIDRTIAEMTLSPEQPPVHSVPGKTIYNVQLDSFRAVLVDDMSKVNRPFIEFLLQNMSGEFAQTTELPMTGQFGFMASLSSFNIANSHWEPVMESAQMTLSLQPEEQDVPRGPNAWYTKTTLSSDRGLELVLSHSLLEQGLAYAARIASVSKEQRTLSAKREITLPYMIHNRTGHPITFWVSGSRRSTLTALADRPLQPSAEDTKVLVGVGEKLPWTHQDWRTLRTSTDTVIPTVACRLEGTQFEAVRNITIDRTGHYAYGLRPRPSEGPTPRLVVDIVVKNGVKHVYMRPPFVFSNDGKYALEIQGQDGTVLEIDPGKTGNFPIGSLSSAIRIRPKGLGYDWSSDCVLMNSSLFSVGKDLLQAYSNHLTDTHLHPPFYYSLYGELEAGHLDPDAQDEADASAMSKVIGRVHFRAPMQFMNQLPYQISYRVYDRTCGFDFGAALAPGAIAQLHFVNAVHVIGLSLEVPDADLRSTEISLINDEEGEMMDATIPMTDGDRVKVSLRLSYARKQGGTRKVILFAPYAILNLTGLTFSLQNNTIVKANQDVAGLTACNEANKVQPVLYSYPESIALRDRIRVRIMSSEWSPPVSMEAVGVMDHFDVEDPEGGLWYNLAMDVQMGPSSYEPCRIVRFFPRFVAVNSTGLVFSCAGFQVPPGTQVPFHVSPDAKKSVPISYLLDSEIISTASVNVNEIGKLFLKAPGSKTGLLRVDRVLTGATIYVSIKDEATWPWELKNESTFDLRYSQSAWKDDHEPTAHMLLPGDNACFSWDEPGAKEKRLIVEVGTKRIPIDIYDIGQLQPVMVKLPGGVKRSLAIDIAADGPVLHVIFRDFDPKKSLFQYRRRSMNSVTSTGTPPPGEDDFEVRSVTTTMLSALCIRFPSIGITLINRHLEEILYIWARDVELRQGNSNLHWTYGLTIGWLQMDNQLFDAWDHPVLLFPAALSKRAQFKAGGEDQQPPFLSLALIQSVDAAHGVRYFKYGGVLLQEVVIDLGEHLMHKLVDFFQFEDTGIDPKKTPIRLVREEDCKLPDMVQLDTTSDLLYFELLQLHPIKVSLSFSKTEGADFDEFASASAPGIYSYNPLETMANVFTTVVGSVSEAPLRFNALVLEHPIVRQAVLLTLIQQHYTQEAVSQIYRVIGSADVLGNPVGLFNTFGSGVSDFFYEPLLGLVSDRPGDIGIGLAKGSISLVRKTVVGLTDTFAKVTGSISKGATLLTFDPAFQQRRRALQSRNRPRHALGGVVASAKHLFAGVTSGLTGIVEKPVEGAKEGGIGGFFKGVGVGVVGAVVKPIVGVFDATTSLTEGIKNTADADAQDIPQVRLPRPVPYDGVLRSYSDHEARGQAILYALHKRQRDDGEHETNDQHEYYVSHLLVPVDEAVALITTRAIFLLEDHSYRVIWRVPLDEVTYARPHKDIILLVVRQPKIKQRMIFVADPKQQEWFCAQVELTMTHYNEQHLLA